MLFCLIQDYVIDYDAKWNLSITYLCWLSILGAVIETLNYCAKTLLHFFIYNDSIAKTTLPTFLFYGISLE